MAWDWYLSMEPLALRIAQDSLGQMTESNYDKNFPDEQPPVPDLTAFKNNLRHGFVIVIMMSCYYESSLNTILRDYMGYGSNGDAGLIKASEGVKLEVIFAGKYDALRGIKGTSHWRDAKKIIAIRNDLVHYKDNLAGCYSSYPPISSWKVGKEIIGEFFTSDTLARCVEAMVSVVHEIAGAVDLKINPLSDVIGGTGNVPTSYFCDEEAYNMICDSDSITSR